MNSIFQHWFSGKFDLSDYDGYPSSGDEESFWECERYGHDLLDECTVEGKHGECSNFCSPPDMKSYRGIRLNMPVGISR